MKKKNFSEFVAIAEPIHANFSPAEMQVAYIFYVNTKASVTECIETMIKVSTGPYFVMENQFGDYETLAGLFKN